MVIVKRQEIRRLVKNVEKRESSALLVENNMEVPPKIKIELPYDSEIPLGIYVKKVKSESWRSCPPICTVVLFIIWKVTETP